MDNLKKLCENVLLNYVEITTVGLYLYLADIDLMNICVKIGSSMKSQHKKGRQRILRYSVSDKAKYITDH